MTKPLFIPDFAALQRKLANPPPLLARMYGRFQERLCWDSEFRRHNIFLAALLGDRHAIAEAKGLLLPLALHPLILTRDKAHNDSLALVRNGLDNHVWCVAPRAMRVATYFTWLERHGAWTTAEREAIGTGVLDFCCNHVIPVLRARTPAGHNQQVSMCLSCAVAGHAFAAVEGLGERARALCDWAMPKLRQALGLMPASGYSGEGSTYQSDVVSPLIMWAGVFLDQLGEQDAWTRRWEPNGACLEDSLKVEAAIGSCGGLLPPWDHYGWARVHNFAARALWAERSRNPSLLPVAETAWDEVDFIAWRPDDRMWTLIYWPEAESLERSPATPYPLPEPRAAEGATVPDSPSPLTGWSLAAVGAATEHPGRRLRAMLAWDRCAGNLQGVCRGQVNPNHLILDFDGEPVTADGWEDGREQLVSDAAMARTLSTLTPTEQELIGQQYGGVETWVKQNQHGFLGMACSVIVDGWESYFPRQAREGVLLHEARDAARHTFTGEAAAYYQPAFDVTRMRRTVSMNAEGVTWVVDDLRAASAHHFTWRLWLRRGTWQSGLRRVELTLGSGKILNLAWAGEAVASLTPVPTFPQGRGERHPWPDAGSTRCDLCLSGEQVFFAVCLVPETAADLTVRAVSPTCWEATWAGGHDRFELPAAVLAAPDPEPVFGKQIHEAETLCDLDEPPFALRTEPDEALLAELDHAPIADWARTGAAMQTLVARSNRAALPKIKALLLDPRHNYTVHSVAAWCLGHARYSPAREALGRMSLIPEANTAARARWALERIEAKDEENQ